MMGFPEPFWSKFNSGEINMKSCRPLNLAVLLFFFIWSAPSIASDLAKEKRWADQIVDSLIDGNAVWLDTGSTKFLGIYTESSIKPAKGTIIVLHGIGVHPDWPDVVYPLRVKLAEQGWNTLSLQMPILANEAEAKDYVPLFPEIAPRMQAAVDFIKGKGAKKIVIVAHSMGSTMAAYYLSKNSNPMVKGLVEIGVSGNPFKEPGLGYLDTLPNLKETPILDLYGSEDLEPVLKSVAQRADVARKSGNTHYTQVMVKGANHFFKGKDTELVQEVKTWLNKNIAQ